jgi:hypothetical protein
MDQGTCITIPDDVPTWQESRLRENMNNKELCGQKVAINEVVSIAQTQQSMSFFIRL